MKNLFFIMPNLKKPHHHYQLDFQKVDQYTLDKWLIRGTANTTRTISCKACDSPVEYHNMECKHDIKGSEGSNTIFKEKVHGQKHQRGV